MSPQSSIQLDQFVEFMCGEWSGSRHHSYKVKHAKWRKVLAENNGVWSANGLRSAYDRYWWNGDFEKNRIELETYSHDIQSAIRRYQDECTKSVAKKIIKWGGIDRRSKNTYEWLGDKSPGISERIQTAIETIRNLNDNLSLFDGKTLKMNSAVTKVVSLADPQQGLVIYDGRVGSALGFFAARFAEERLGGVELAPILKFAVDKSSHPKTKEKRRDPSTPNILFRPIFGQNKNRLHAEMVRISSEIIARMSVKCAAEPRKIEAALFMWGYDVRGLKE